MAQSLKLRIMKSGSMSTEDVKTDDRWQSSDRKNEASHIWKQEKARQGWFGAGARARVHTAIRHLAVKRWQPTRWWESEEDKI